MEQENTCKKYVHDSPSANVIFIKKHSPSLGLFISLKPEATVWDSLRLFLAVNFMVPRAGLQCRRGGGRGVGGVPNSEECDGEGAGVVVVSMKTSGHRGRKESGGRSRCNIFQTIPFPNWGPEHHSCVPK